MVLASTNLSEWANIRSGRSTSGWSATGGLVGNPWALDRSAGGSSSGSGAALAAGLPPLAVGTETDGSIVCPASVNGVVGLKPTVGTVPTDGVVPISASQDSPGPMARRVDDVARLFAVLADVGPVDLADTGPRFVHATTWRTGHPPDRRGGRRVRRRPCAAGQPVEGRDVATPGPEVVDDEFSVLLAELVDDLGAYLASRPGGGVRSLADVVAHEHAHADVELPWFGDELLHPGPGHRRPGRRRLRRRPRTQPRVGGDDLPRAGPRRCRRAGRPRLRAGLEERPGRRRPCRRGVQLGDHAGGHRRMAGHERTRRLVHGLPIGLPWSPVPARRPSLLAAAARVESVVAAAPRPAAPVRAGPAPRRG